MLVAVLNTCTKEELEESDEEEEVVSPMTSAVPAPEESDQRRKVIKNKIMAVGRVARVFALLRYVMPVNVLQTINRSSSQRGRRKGLRTQKHIRLEQAAIWYSGFRIRRYQKCHQRLRGRVRAPSVPRSTHHLTHFTAGNPISRMRDFHRTSMMPNLKKAKPSSPQVPYLPLLQKGKKLLPLLPLTA